MKNFKELRSVEECMNVMLSLGNDPANVESERGALNNMFEVAKKNDQAVGRMNSICPVCKSMDDNDRFILVQRGSKAHISTANGDVPKLVCIICRAGLNCISSRCKLTQPQVKELIDMLERFSEQNAP